MKALPSILSVCFTALAVALAGLCLRSLWHCDEVGVFWSHPLPHEHLCNKDWVQDRRCLIGSYHGGLFLFSAVGNITSEDIDWQSGPRWEIITRHSVADSLVQATLLTFRRPAFEPEPRWAYGGFQAGRGVAPYEPRHWSYDFVVIPYWVPLLLAFWPLGHALRRRAILRRRQSQGCCLKCGYDLRHSGPVCSECGQPRLSLAQRPMARAPRWLMALVVTGIAGCVVTVAFWHLRLSGHAQPPLLVGPGTILRLNNLPERVELDIGGNQRIRCALIPCGSFLMGSPADEPNRHNDEVQHRVCLTKPFYMGVTTVTQGQYESVMGDNPSYYQAPENPQYWVTWDSAADFCRRVSQRVGWRVRLPTETEWEYACRAGTTTAFNVGQWLPRDAAKYETRGSYPSLRPLPTPPWTDWPPLQPTPVASFAPNAWGLYDMHGNVPQWCSDWYGSYPKSDASDPIGPEAGYGRVRRGADCGEQVDACRSARRDSAAPVDHTGFRIVLDVP